MNKPLMMVIEEAKKSIYDIINQTCLHPAIVKNMILNDICMDVDRFIDETIKKENESYYKEVEKEKIQE
jgi:hypothetical protein